MKKDIKKDMIKTLPKNPVRIREHDLNWDQKFNQLLKYKNENGHCNIPNPSKDRALNPQLLILYNWISKQRQINKKGKLLSEHKNRLINIGFDFHPHDTKWEQKFNELLNYKAIYGHCNVNLNKKENKLLASWISKQRTDRYKLSKKRKKRLLDAGFVFDIINLRWEKHFNELVEYKKIFGDCNVSNYNNKKYTKLVHWLTRMREVKRLKNRNILTIEQEKRLNAIGFDWNPRLTLWMMHYNDLKTFYIENGHSIVPYNYTKLNRLGEWVERERRKKDKQTADQKKLLKDLDFEWDLNVAKKKYFELRKKK